MAAKRGSAHDAINVVRKQLDMTEQELWIAYQTHGGTATRQEISAFLRGMTSLAKEEVDRLALALTDEFTGEPTEPTSPHQERPASGTAPASSPR